MSNEPIELLPATTEPSIPDAFLSGSTEPVWVAWETGTDYYAQPEPTGIFTTLEKAKAAYPEVSKWQEGNASNGLKAWSRDDEGDEGRGPTLMQTRLDERWQLDD